MKRVSQYAENLLKEILRERDEKGNCKISYWKERFDTLSGAESMLTRSGFKELIDAELIFVSWADNCPYVLYVLSKGKSYFDDSDVKNERSFTGVNNFYGEAHGVVIQQGSVNTNYSFSKGNIDNFKIRELIETIHKYNASLESEYGQKGAEELRKATEELESNLDAQPEKKRGILTYIRDLSVNAGGGLIAGGIINLIASII